MHPYTLPEIKLTRIVRKVYLLIVMLFNPGINMINVTEINWKQIINAQSLTTMFGLCQ